MNKKIRDNYDKYCSFINEEKILAKDQMILDEDKASRPDFKACWHTVIISQKK